MRLLITDQDPHIAASHLDDSRITLAIVQIVNILSIVYGGPHRIKDKKLSYSVMANWARNPWRTPWLLEYLEAVHARYIQLRITPFNKDILPNHKCYDSWHAFAKMRNIQPRIDYSEVKQFPNMTLYKYEKDVHMAYKKLLEDKWEVAKKPVTFNGLELSLEERKKLLYNK